MYIALLFLITGFNALAVVLLQRWRRVLKVPKYHRGNLRRILHKKLAANMMDMISLALIGGTVFMWVYFFRN